MRNVKFEKGVDDWWRDERMKEDESVATLIEPVVRQEATKKSLLSSLNDLDEQLKAAAAVLNEEAEMVVTLAEQLENLSSDHAKIQEELTDHSYATEQISQRSSDMEAAILAMQSQIEVKEEEMLRSKQEDELKLKQIQSNYEKNCSQYFHAMSTWSEEEKSTLKAILDLTLGSEMNEREVETLFQNQSVALTEKFGEEV